MAWRELCTNCPAVKVGKNDIDAALNYAKERPAEGHRSTYRRGRCPKFGAPRSIRSCLGAAGTDATIRLEASVVPHIQIEARACGALA